VTSFTYNDGGRAETGYRGKAGDCVVRAIAIATQQPYGDVYSAINELAKKEIVRKRSRSSARNGVGRKVYQPYLESLGWRWVPTMKIGAGCKVHLRAEELPAGRLIVRASKHIVAVIDGVINDTYDSSRDGRRCVYGYFHKPEK
jgi:hypothetical protein